MPRARASSSRGSDTRAICPPPTFEERELLFETTFAIREDFQNLEATQWAVAEFKRRGLNKLFKPVTTTAYRKLVIEFYANLWHDCNNVAALSSKVKGKAIDVTRADIAAALQCNHEHPPEAAQLAEQPARFYVTEIIEDMCDGQYADSHHNAGSRSKLPQRLWFVDSILHRNAFPLGHKSQRRDQFLQTLYAFHKDAWYSIPDIIWNQIQKFWNGVHIGGAESTHSWGLPFPYLISYILRKKGIKGTAADEPVTTTPIFGIRQWNKSLSHMPRGPAPGAEESEAEPMAEDEPEVEPEASEEEEQNRSLIEEIAGLRRELAGQRKEASKTFKLMDKRLDTLEELMQSILTRLPPPSAGASSSGQQ